MSDILVRTVNSGQARRKGSDTETEKHLVTVYAINQRKEMHVLRYFYSNSKEIRSPIYEN